MTLSSIQKSHLRGLAHKLKPYVIIGNHGLTEKVHAEIEQVLQDHELTKIRINAETRDDRKTITQAICQQHQATLIQTIGHIIVVYRATKKTS